MSSASAQERRQEAIRELARRELAKRRLIQFTCATLDGYKPGWIHYDVADRLERFSRAVTEQKSPRLLLMMPPRTGKSELASIRLPAWHLGHNPRHEIINAGYNMELPMIFSRKVRAILRDPFYQQLFPDTVLSSDSQSVETWSTTAMGGYSASGVGSGLTGKGCHILIIDDPIKNMEEADSADRRNLIDDWYQSVAYTRLAPGGGVLVIQTCWNFDDLAGRLQERMRIVEGADQFEVVRYPAISDEGHEYRDNDTYEIVRTPELLVPVPANYTLLREKGTALHEDRYSTEFVLRQKANMFPRIWEALYQQRPAPDEGMYFQKDFIHHTPVQAGVIPADAMVYTAWDFAIGQKTSNDYTVGATVTHDPDDNVVVRDIQRFRGDALEIVDTMIDTAIFWSKVANRRYTMGVEDGQIWKSIKPLFEQRMHERREYVPYKVMKPLTDKLARARPLQGRMQQRRVWFPTDAPWMAAVTKEMLQFPGGAHDDIVDALAWVVRLCVESPAPRATPPEKKKSWRDKLDTLVGMTGATHMSA